MTDWMTIRVVLAGQPDAPLAQPPGRTMLAHADHSFADLAEAIDTAFARWDLTPLHQFEVEGRVLLPADASAEDPEAETSDEVTVGEVGLRTGARFTYVFDLGEEWAHECVVEEVGVDPFEVAGEEPDLPIPVFGWGTVPDQYGRLSEDDDEDYDDYEDDEDDEDLDDAGWAASDGASSWPVVRDALAGVRRDLDEPALEAATARLRTRAGDASGAERTLWAASGLDPGEAPGDEQDLWLALAAGVVAPRGDVPLDAETQAAWEALEPADWAGAVIEIVREGPGAEVTPARTLEAIARCPEVEENDLTEEGESALLRGLDVVIGMWLALGIVDGDRRLTALGHWGLPEALRRAWEGGEAPALDR